MTEKRHFPWQALSTASSTAPVPRGQRHEASSTAPVPRGDYYEASSTGLGTTRQVLRGQTARRSVPTSEIFGLHPGFLPQTQPRLSTSEVGRFLRKRHSGEHDREAPLSLASTLDGQFHTASSTRPAPRGQYYGNRPLGDRSLPRRSSGYIQGSFHKLSPTHHNHRSHTPSQNSHRVMQPHTQCAIDSQRCPRQKTRPLGCQPHGRARHLVGLPDTPRRVKAI